MLTEQVLKRMTPDISGSSLLVGLPLLVPKLKRLALSAHFDLDDQVILDMVQSRMGLACPNGSVAERPVELVALDITWQLSPGTISQMALWRRSGSKIWVKSLEKNAVNTADDMLSHCRYVQRISNFRDDSGWLGSLP
jgi:hypothetical protein